MLAGNVNKGTGEGARTTQPFVGDNAQRVLVAGKTCLTLELLRRCIWNRPGRLLVCLRIAAMRDYDQAKITEQDLPTLPNKYILGLDIPVNQPAHVGMIQGRGYLLHHRHNLLQLYTCLFGDNAPDRAIGGIAHDEVRNALFTPVVEDTHDIRVIQAGNDLCLVQKILERLL